MCVCLCVCLAGKKSNDFDAIKADDAKSIDMTNYTLVWIIYLMFAWVEEKVEEERRKSFFALFPLFFSLSFFPSSPSHHLSFPIEIERPQWPRRSAHGYPKFPPY